MRIEMIFDETGTISSSSGNEVYGAGCVFFDSAKRAQIDQFLAQEKLDKIHMRLLSREGKLAVADAIGKCRFNTMGLHGVAVLRNDDTFKSRIAEAAIYKQIVEKPELAILAAKRNLSKKQQKKTILTPKEIVPKVFQNIKLQEVVLQITRYPILQALSIFGVEDILIRWSAIGDPQKHVEKIRPATSIILAGLNDVLNHVKLSRPDLNLEAGVLKNIDINIESTSFGLFGLADFVAYVGRMLAHDEQSENFRMGIDLYTRAKEFFPSRIFLEESEPWPGIYVRKAD